MKNIQQEQAGKNGSWFHKRIILIINNIPRKDISKINM
jgi:hypothetical protein